MRFSLGGMRTRGRRVRGGMARFFNWSWSLRLFSPWIGIRISMPWVLGVLTGSGVLAVGHLDSWKKDYGELYSTLESIALTGITMPLSGVLGKWMREFGTGYIAGPTVVKWLNKAGMKL